MSLAFIASIMLFAPFVLYVLVKKKSGWGKGVAVAMVSSVLVLLPVLWIAPDLKLHLFFAVSIVLALGSLSLYLNHPLYFLLEPAIKSWATACYLLVFRLLGKSFLLQAAESLQNSPELMKRLPPEVSSRMNDPAMQEFILTSVGDMEQDLIITMIIYGFLMVYVARKWGDVSWLVFKALFTPFIFVGAAIGFIVRNML